MMIKLIINLREIIIISPFLFCFTRTIALCYPNIYTDTLYYTDAFFLKAARNIIFYYLLFETFKKNNIFCETLILQKKKKTNNLNKIKINYLIMI